MPIAYKYLTGVSEVEGKFETGKMGQWYAIAGDFRTLS